ncbi:MAG TPA: hypothetical protein VJX67_26535 [Blastocatellia bacterium]|nr:hypothetical protein [Blastocatellia bacterium]
MSKRKRRTPDRRLSGQSHRRVIIVAASVAVFLLSSIGLLAARRRATTRTMVQSGPTDPAHPSKEYIYAGGRMVATEEPAASTTPNYIGFLDHVGCDTIFGWAADRNRLNTSINVQIYDGTTLTSTVLANLYRPGVDTLLGDNGLHGFSIATPVSLKDGATHSVHVKFEASTTELTNSPTAVTCTGAPSYVGFLDHVGCDNIFGWAADRNRLNAPLNVSIYDGNTLIAVVTANLFRAGVGPFVGDNGLHGFVITTPASLKDGVAHSIHVKFESSSTELSGSPTSLTCAVSPPNYIGFLDHAGCDAIYGWVADRNRLNTPITASIYNGSTLITTVQANIFRPGVDAFLGDNGMHGFNIPTPLALKTGSTLSVHVQFEAGSTDLSGSPVSLTCSLSAPSYVGFLDHAGCDNIAGWAADQNRLNTSINVQIYDGSTLIATVQGNLFRTGVDTLLGDNGLHGFSIPTPAALKNSQAHSVHVKFEASTTELTNSPASLTCP